MNFEGKVLVINTINGGGAVIENAEIRQLGGEAFVIGTSTLRNERGPTWTSGLRIWISVRNIVSITEVPDTDEYVQRCRLHNMPQPFRVD